MNRKVNRRAILVWKDGKETDRLLDGDASSQLTVFDDDGWKFDFELVRLRDVDGVMRPVYHEYEPEDRDR